MEEQQISQTSQPVANVNSFIPIGDLLKKSFNVYLSIWKPLVLLILLMYGVMIGLFLILVMLGIVSGFTSPDFSTSSLFAILLFLVVMAIVVLLSVWTQVAMMYVVKERSNPIGVKQALAVGWSKISSFVWIGFLSGLAVLGGFILFIVPGIIFAIWFTFSAYVFISEGVVGTKALSRSKQLVSGNWWGVFGRFFVGFFVVGLIMMVVSWIPLVGSIANSLFTTPFFVIYTYLMYEDLKRLKG